MLGQTSRTIRSELYSWLSFKAVFFFAPGTIVPCELWRKELQKGKGTRKSPQTALSTYIHSKTATTPGLSGWLGSVSKHLLQGPEAHPLESGRKFPTGSLAIQMP